MGREEGRREREGRRGGGEVGKWEGGGKKKSEEGRWRGRKGGKKWREEGTWGGEERRGRKTKGLTSDQK